MDIAYYLSELLGQLGEVSVPGLGNFTQKKIEGYYNDAEGKFYPPASRVNYKPDFADDDILAEYIAEKKKISLASSKYFIEKYVGTIKQDAILKDVQLADLGWLRFEVHELNFKSAGTLTNSPAFYGYPQIELKKLGSTMFSDQAEAFYQAPKDELPATELQDEPVMETEIPVAHHEETPSPELQDEPLTEAGTAEFDLEAYLRELETGAGITQAETNAAKPESIPQPGQEEEIPEPTSPAEAEIESTEPVMDLPEPGSIIQETEPVMDVPLPVNEPYTPESGLQSPVPKSTPGISQPETYIPSTSVFTPKPQQEVEEEFIFDGKGYDNVDNEISEKASQKWLWIGLLGTAALILAGVLIFYLHQQSQLNAQKTLAIPVVKKVPLKKDTVKATPADSLKDSIKKAVAADTAKKISPQVNPPNGIAIIDSTKVRYELVGVSCNTMADANVCVINYKSLGFSDAHVIIPTPPGWGNLIKVSLGTFANRADAINKKRELLNTGNIKTIDLRKFNPKK